MKKALFISCFVMSLFVHSYGQINCDDYKIVSILDIPPTPQTPGGNYFLLLLTLDEDNLANIDIYANLFFTDASGDTISIPTGPNSTLPRYASDTIPYILKLNSPDSNQDFPEEFNGKLVIIHATQLICEVGYSNVVTTTNNLHGAFELNIYPNPFVDFINVNSNKHIDRIFIVDSDGRIVDKFHPKSFFYKMNLKDLHSSKYFILIQFKDEEIEVYEVIKT